MSDSFKSSPVIARSFRALGELYARHWVAQILFLASAFALVFISPLQDRARHIGQPYEAMRGLEGFPAELGSNLVRVRTPVDGELTGLDFSFANERKTPLEFFFREAGGAFLALRVRPRDRDGVLEALSIEDGRITILSRAPAPRGPCRIDMTSGIMRAQCGSDAVEIHGDAPRDGAPFYLRAGMRALFAYELTPPPDDLVARMKTPFGDTVLRIGARGYLRIIGIALFALLLYACFALLPAALLSPQFEARKLLLAQIVAFVLSWIALLAFPPLVAGFLGTPKPSFFRTPPISTAVSVNGPEGRIPLKKPAGRKRVLILGGSAAAGLPFKMSDSVSGGMNRLAEKRGLPIDAINLSQASWHAANFNPYLGSVLKTLKPDAVVSYWNFNSFNVGLTPSLALLIYQVVLQSPHIGASPYQYNLRKKDAVFAEADRFIDAARASGAAYYMADDPVGAFYPSFGAYDKFRRELTNRATLKGATVIPLFDAFSSEESEYLFFDACHLTKAGYEKAAEMVLKTLATPF